LTFQFRDRLLQHLAMPRFAGGVQLLGEALVRKTQAFAFPVAFLLLGRDCGGDSLPPLRHFLLLLFYGFTFPASRHLNGSYLDLCGANKKPLACDP